MVDDPINGDLQMQEYLYPVMASAAIIWYYGVGAYSTNATLDEYMELANNTYPDFILDYQSNATTLQDVHMTEWKV
jgi:hypothetical protein